MSLTNQERALAKYPQRIDANEFTYPGGAVISIQQAAYIQGLEDAGEWMPYPENKPEDGNLCWFYSSRYSNAFIGNYWYQDAFKREGVFTSKDGGHFAEHVTHFIPVTRPQPPIK